MPTVQLLPDQGPVNVRSGMLLIDALLENDMKIQMSCGGSGICATCHVRVRAGMDQLSPVTSREKRTLGLLAESTECSRLACQSEIQGDGIVVELPKGMYIEKADDLIAMIGSRAPVNILHPISGKVLIPLGKIITRTLLDQSRRVDQEVCDMRAGLGMSSLHTKRKLNPNVKEGSPTDIGDSTSTGGTSHRSVSNQSSSFNQSFKLQSAKVPGPLIPTPLQSPVSQTLARKKSASIENRPDPEIRIGSKIGKFLILECVGQGSLGQVFRALHTSLNIPVAIKFLRMDRNRSAADFLERFRTEARLLAQLNHLNVIHIFDFEDSLPSPFVVMEFVNGSSLMQLIDQLGKIQLSRALRIIDQVAAGLEAGRELGIIHCDIKPANILLTRDGTVKIVDFGLAQRLTSRVGSKSSEANIEGSLAYMSPEQFDGTSKIDHRTDIYAIGITLFQLITGELPFKGRNSQEIILSKMTSPTPLAHEVSPGLPMSVSEWIVKLTSKNPEGRPATYAAIRSQIRKLLAMPGGAK